MNDLENQEQEFNDLLKIAGHALHTPLAAIQQAAKIIIFESEASPNARFLNDLYEIREAADQLSDLLDKVWQAFQADLHYTERTAVNLHQVIQKALARVGALSSIHVISQIPDDLPPVLVNTDAIEEVVFILITRIIRTLSEADIYISVSTESGAIVISMQNSRQAQSNEILNLKDFLRERDNLSLELLGIWQVLRSQGGRLWISGEANSPKINIRFPLSTKNRS
jgi:light-regulated signal transduction histidine kinase (bacteriophytochrome)